MHSFFSLFSILDWEIEWSIMRCWTFFIRYRQDINNFVEVLGQLHLFATGANIPDLRVVHRHDRHGVRGNLLRDHLSNDGHRQHRLQPHRGNLPHPRCWIIRWPDHFRNWLFPPGLYLWNGIALCSSTASVVTWMVQFYLRLTHNLLIREYRSASADYFKTLL